jgi:hypothetical protein
MNELKLEIEQFRKERNKTMAIYIRETWQCAYEEQPGQNWGTFKAENLIRGTTQGGVHFLHIL